MFSIRNIMKRFLVVTLIIVVLAFLINFVFLPATKSSISTINKEINDLKTQAMNIKLPIRVLDNIALQVIADPQKKSNVNLIEAFNGNLLKLQISNEKISNKKSILEKDLNKINSYSLFFYQLKINEMNDISAQITEITNNFKNVLLSSQIDEIDIDTIKIYGSDLMSNVVELELVYQIINDNILKSYTIAVNFIFTVIIIMLLLLTLAVYKIINYDQQFVLESFKNMENKIFEFDKLPKAKPIFKEEHMIYNRVKVIFEEEKFAQKIKSVVATTYHIDDLMKLLFEEISKSNAVDRIGITFVDYSRNKFIAEYSTALYDDIKLGPGFEVDFDETSLTDILTTKASFITNDLEIEFQKRPNSAALKLLREENIQSNLVIPLHMGEAVFGVIFFASMKKDHFDVSDMRLAEKIIYEISGLLNRAYFTKVILSKVTNSFAEIVDQKDNETGGHIVRMVAYSTLIAKGLMNKNIEGYEVNEKFVLEIERNASSHDIGKVGIPDKILKKPGKLTPEEWTIMKTHSEIGADVFKSLREGLQVFGSNFYEYAEVIARSHHERWDGTGYPDGLEGHNIPLAARIVAVADVFDALTSKRYYKESFGFEKSLAIIKESKGTHLDAVVVDVFLDQIDEILKIQKLYNVD